VASRAAAAAEQPEGLAWLGREPDARAPLGLRATRVFGRFLAYTLARATLRVEGREHLPPGPYMTACAIHRSWLDALVIIEALPLEPRVWFIASGRAAFKSRSRRFFFRRLGGILPVYRGGYSIEPSVASVRAVKRAGAVLGFFPEGARKGPPDAMEPFRGGLGYLALRTGMTIVPMAVAGTKELYLGKRVAVRILPPVDPLMAAGVAAPPPEGSREEREAAHRITSHVRDLLDPHVRELAAWTADPPDKPRRLAWISRMYA
jgi:1-acyl-sn-glycerol-3-phosphate acyltransferase